MNPEIDDLLGKLQGNAEAGDEIKAVGPADVGPTVETKDGGELVTLDYDEDLMKLLWAQVEKAESRRQNREKAWELLLAEYMPIVSASGQAETVKVQAHFRNTHTKLGALFFKSPDLILEPNSPGPADNVIPDPRTGNPQFAGQQFPPLTLADAVPLKQAVLNQKMGRNGIKSERLFGELLFDVLQWSGLGCYKLGYQCTMRTIQVPKMIPDPNALPAAQQYGATLGLNGAPPPPQIQATHPVTGDPLTEDQQVPVFEEWYARRFSPKRYLCDPYLRSTRINEDAAWTGMDFFLTPKQASDRFKIPVGEMTKGAKDDRHYEWTDDNGATQTDLVHCIELWVKSSIFTPDANPHPQALNQLVLIKGLKTKPAIWRPSPDQTFDPQTGQITTDSLVGFPIGALTIRDLADSCFPPSDAAFTNSDIKQMSTWRRQSIRIRDAAIGKYLYDASAFGPDEVEMLKNGDIGDFISVEEGKLQEGVDKIFAQTSKIQSSADDSRGFAGIKQDMSETLGIGSNQSGTETDTVRTATEADRVAQAVQSRNDTELGRVVDCYLDIARQVDQLLMRYMTDVAYIQIGGDQAAAAMKAWTGKTIMLSCLYDIAPDSRLRPDTAREWMMAKEHWNLVAQNPMTNQSYLLKRMARMQGLDPAKAVQPPPPPPPPAMEPLKMSLAITVEDLTNPLVMALLDKFGSNIDPSVKMAEKKPGEMGGPAPKAPVVSEHTASNSGGKQNAPGAENHREGQMK